MAVHNRWCAMVAAVVLLSGSFVMLSAAEQGVAREESAQDKSGEGGETLIRLTPEHIRVAGIKVAAVEEKEFFQEIKAAGEVVLNADRTAHVGPRIPGRIVKISAFLGDKVKAGQSLLIIDSVELGHTKAEFHKAWARMELMKRNYEREKRLFESRITSERVMLEARTAYEEARIQFETTRETLLIFGVPSEQIDRMRASHEGEGTTLLQVPAPFAGIIVEKHATNGEVIDPSDILYKISDLSTVWVETHIYEKDLRFIRKGSPATLTVSAYPDEVFKGSITYISDLLDEATRTVKLRVEVANPERKLRSGMFADVSVHSFHSEDRVRKPAVPAVALQNSGEDWIVYVTEDGLSFKERKVRIGERQNDYVAVFSGLKPGERVATEGSFFIKSEAGKEAF